MKQRSLALPICALFCGLSFAQQASGPLTNQRIADLVAVGVSASEILRIIAVAPNVSFDLTPAATGALMKAGISEELIKAMSAKEQGISFSPSIPQHYAAPATATAQISVPTQVSTVPVRSAVLRSSGILYQGTPVRMKIMHTVSSADAQVGNNVDFQTLDDVMQGGIVVIPKGSTAIATITVAESKKRVARGGKLGMNIDFVRLPNGDQLPLRGMQNLKGGGHVGAMTGAMVATAIVFWPAAPFFLFMHGKDITIPEGHEVTVYTNTDYRFAE